MILSASPFLRSFNDFFVRFVNDRFQRSHFTIVERYTSNNFLCDRSTIVLNDPVLGSMNDPLKRSLNDHISRFKIIVHDRFQRSPFIMVGRPFRTFRFKNRSTIVFMYPFLLSNVCKYRQLRLFECGTNFLLLRWFNDLFLQSLNDRLTITVHGLKQLFTIVSNDPLS